MRHSKADELGPDRMRESDDEAPPMPDDVEEARRLLATLTNDLRMHERIAERIRRDIFALQAKMTDAIDLDLRSLRSARAPRVHGTAPSTGTGADRGTADVPVEHGGPSSDGAPAHGHAPDGGSSDRGQVRPRRHDASGEAPTGFASQVRRIAHRSIAEARRPLERAEIIEDIKASGIPLPKTFLPQKVSRVLARDLDLVNHRGEGYSLTDDALRRELERPR